MNFLKEHWQYIAVLLVAVFGAAVLYATYRFKSDCELRGGVAVRATFGGNVCLDVKNMV